MIVLKFGGTSVGSAEVIQNAITIAWSQADHAPVVVCSAMAKTTDTLVRLAQAALDGREDQVRRELDLLSTLHLDALAGLTSGETRSTGQYLIQNLLDELSSLARGLLLIQEVSPRSKDALLSFGERLSTTLIWLACVERGISAELLDSREFIKTDEKFTEASILPQATQEAITARVKPRNNHLIICQGFIASTMSGVTTTLGRGGSDYSATIIGAALQAQEVQIWTDVTGIMTTDPRLIASAKTISEISYEEAAELSFFGAKVIHPSTIQPAVEKEIPVLVKNTNAPEQPGTRICRTVKNRGIQAITGKNGITVVTVQSSRMLNAHGFLKAIFSVFEKHRISVDLVSTSEVSVSMTVNRFEPSLEQVIQELQSFSRVNVEPDHGIVSLVGTDLWKEASFTARVFAALRDIPVRMISLGSSDINLSVVVPQENLEQAITLLHQELFPQGEKG